MHLGATYILSLIYSFPTFNSLSDEIKWGLDSQVTPMHHIKEHREENIYTTLLGLSDVTWRSVAMS